MAPHVLASMGSGLRAADRLIDEPASHAVTRNHFSDLEIRER